MFVVLCTNAARDKSERGDLGRTDGRMPGPGVVGVFVYNPKQLPQYTIRRCFSRITLELCKENDRQGLSTVSNLPTCLQCHIAHATFYDFFLVYLDAWKIRDYVLQALCLVSIPLQRAGLPLQFRGPKRHPPPFPLLENTYSRPGPAHSRCQMAIRAWESILIINGQASRILSPLESRTTRVASVAVPHSRPFPLPEPFRLTIP